MALSYIEDWVGARVAKLETELYTETTSTEKALELRARLMELKSFIGDAKSKVASAETAFGKLKEILNGKK